jgi:hypothetical protein
MCKKGWPVGKAVGIFVEHSLLTRIHILREFDACRVGIRWNKERVKAKECIRKFISCLCNRN